MNWTLVLVAVAVLILCGLGPAMEQVRFWRAYRKAQEDRCPKTWPTIDSSLLPLKDDKTC